MSQALSVFHAAYKRSLSKLRSFILHKQLYIQKDSFLMFHFSASLGTVFTKVPFAITPSMLLTNVM